MERRLRHEKRGWREVMEGRWKLSGRTSLTWEFESKWEGLTWPETSPKSHNPTPLIKSSATIPPALHTFTPASIHHSRQANLSIHKSALKELKNLARISRLRHLNTQLHHSLSKSSCAIIQIENNHHYSKERTRRGFLLIIGISFAFVHSKAIAKSIFSTVSVALLVSPERHIRAPSNCSPNAFARSLNFHYWNCHWARQHCACLLAKCTFPVFSLSPPIRARLHFSSQRDEKKKKRKLVLCWWYNK